MRHFIFVMTILSSSAFAYDKGIDPAENNIVRPDLVEGSYLEVKLLTESQHELKSEAVGCRGNSSQSVHPFAEPNELLLSDYGKVIEIYFPATRDGLPLRMVSLGASDMFGGFLVLFDSREYAGYKFVQISLGPDVIDKIEVTPAYEPKTMSLCVTEEPAFKLSQLLRAERPKKTGKRY